MRHPGWWAAAGIFIAGLFAATFFFRSFDDSARHRSSHPEYPPQYAVQTFPDETPPIGSGMRHLNPGEVVQYNSNPPTNGKHANGVAPWGVSAAPVPPAVAVHNMEHGGVVVWYSCDGGPAPLDEPACDQLLTDLSAIVSPLVDDGLFVLMTPYTGTEDRISLTAWQYLDSFNEVDETRIQAFVDSFECRFNPERTCG